MSKESLTGSEACPVDPATRSVWLEKSQISDASSPDIRTITSTRTGSSTCSSNESQSITTPPSIGDSKDTSLVNKIFQQIFAPWPAPPTERRSAAGARLSQEREISTIPRATSTTAMTDPARIRRPANSEREGGTSPTGNWIYPSEQMFFEAMQRKGYATAARDMKTVVPIHNAVNERAWREIKAWEKPYGSEEACGGPRLLSFSGLSTSLTPKARFNTWLGYVAPFDRHDWLVDRCGTHVEYVIDFYAGRDEGNEKLNFYLDVRPKLNSWEGCKMRFSKLIGLV